MRNPLSFESLASNMYHFSLFSLNICSLFIVFSSLITMYLSRAFFKFIKFVAIKFGQDCWICFCPNMGSFFIIIPSNIYFALISLSFPSGIQLHSSWTFWWLFYFHLLIFGVLYVTWTLMFFYYMFVNIFCQSIAYLFTFYVSLITYVLYLF